MNTINTIPNYPLELESLINENYEKLYACVYRLVGTHQDAEDVLQSGLLKAFKYLHTFKGASTLYTWLYRILINESNRYYTKLARLPLMDICDKTNQSEQSFFDSIGYEENFEEDLIMDEMREKCLHAFMRCLPKAQRVVFLLKTALHLKNKEIGEIMNLSEANVKVTLHRSRKALQNLFEMRCSLIDPDKPCSCHLWIKFMRDHELPLPKDYKQPKTDVLRTELYKNLSKLNKINYLYTVEPPISKELFIQMLQAELVRFT